MPNIFANMQIATLGQPLYIGAIMTIFLANRAYDIMIRPWLNRILPFNCHLGAASNSLCHDSIFIERTSIKIYENERVLSKALYIGPTKILYADHSEDKRNLNRTSFTWSHECTKHKRRCTHQYSSFTFGFFFFFFWLIVFYFIRH